MSRSESFFRTLVEGSGELIAVLGADETAEARYVSPSFAGVLGYAPAELIGRDLLEFVHPGDLPRAQAFREELLAEAERTRPFECRVRHANGSWRSLEISARNLLHVPTVAGFVLNAHDVTEMRRDRESMRNLAARLRAVTELASVVVGATTLDELQGSLAMYLSAVVPLDAVTLALYDPAAYALTVIGSQDGGERRHVVVPVAGTPSEEVIRERLPLVMNRSEGVATSAFASAGLGAAAESSIRVPLLSSGDVLGVLKVASSTPELYTAEDVEVAQAMAAIVATAVVKIRMLNAREAAEAALRRGEERYRRLVDVLPDAMLVQVNEQIVFANPAAIRELGGGSDLVGRPMWDVLAPEEREVIRERIRGIASTREAVALVPVRMRTLGGRPLHAEVSAAPIEFDGRPGSFIVARDQTEHLQAEARIALQARLLEGVGQAVLAADMQRRLIYWNPAAERLLGWTSDEVLGRRAADLPLQPAHVQRRIEEALGRGESWTGEVDFNTRDGRTTPVLCVVTPVLDEQGRTVGAVGIHTDLRQTRELEQQLRQAQKMEAVGRLAGGVAHDFNNILVAIRGYGELALDGTSPDAEARADMIEVLHAADRAAALTRQLLAFSRKQVLQPRVLDLGGIIANVEKMLRRLIGEDITLLVDSDAGILVEADPAQLEQVLLNLAVNARDAMPRGGRILIRAEISVALEAVSEARIPAGSYARLSVIDTGIGMDAETRGRIFEPFFTTKSAGNGTGLGLSTVYGIVAQSGGYIRVISEPGEGATFEILLPLADGPESDERRKTGRGNELAGMTGTILLVEDESTVRTFMRRVLEGSGFTVLEAANAQEAAAITEEAERSPDLLVTDVIMPGPSGLELTRSLSRKNPALSTLCVSGYSEEMLRERGALERVSLLMKPFTRAELIAKVAELLSKPRS